MIILKKLKWDNCFSYGKENNLDLDNSTLTQLVGTNGTGKSSLPLIIEEVLYNKNSKGIKSMSIFDHTVRDIEGKEVSLRQFRGAKAFLVINVASK